MVCTLVNGMGSAELAIRIAFRAGLDGSGFSSPGFPACFVEFSSTNVRCAVASVILPLYSPIFAPWTVMKVPSFTWSCAWAPRSSRSVGPRWLEGFREDVEAVVD